MSVSNIVKIATGAECADCGATWEGPDSGGIADKHRCVWTLAELKAALKVWAPCGIHFETHYADAFVRWLEEDGVNPYGHPYPCKYQEEHDA